MYNKKPRNPIAKDLRTTKYRMRVVTPKINRKDKHKGKMHDLYV